MYFEVSESTLWAIAILAVLGHCYSAYLKLEGGKGVATGLGVYLVLIPIPTLIGAGVWIVCAKSFENIIFIFTFRFGCSCN